MTVYQSVRLEYTTAMYMQLNVNSVQYIDLIAFGIDTIPATVNTIELKPVQSLYIRQPLCVLYIFCM